MKQAQRSGGLWRFLGLSMLLWLCTLASLQAQSSLQSQPAANASGNASTNASTNARPIRVLLGLPPGGSVELLARIYADRLRAALGVPVLIENRAGASGLIAMEAMLAAPRDGTTLLFAPNGGVTLVPQIMKSARFDPFKDVQPLARVGHAGFVLAVNAKVTASNVSEFLAQARSDQSRGLHHREYRAHRAKLLWMRDSM
jgi:tripartite-type tricarboxylate transporter receptor subunit TctC